MSRTLNVESILRAQDELMAVKPAIGYTQNAIGRRKVVDPKTMTWRPGSSSDCSFITASVMMVAGLVLSGWQKIVLYSGNIISVLVSTGLYRKIDVRRYKTLPALTAVLQPGDAMAGPGHVISVGRDGRFLSWEHDERGKSTGGKDGWQKGEKTGWRAPYMRSRGWTSVARLIPTAEFLGRALAAWARSKSWKSALDLFAVRAPADVTLWRTFLDQADRWVRGKVKPLVRPAVTPGQDHAYVVLGGTISQMNRRLAMALVGLQMNPESRVVVTGGVERSGQTEAAYMVAWLVRHGIAVGRIFSESRAQSTVGNARFSVPILIGAGVHHFTIVSDASHVVRAQCLFLAALLQIETAGSGIHPTGVSLNPPIGCPDSRTPASRATIAAHIAALLRLTDQYQAAL